MAAMASGTLMKMKSVRRDLHEQSNTCALYGPVFEQRGNRVNRAGRGIHRLADTPPGSLSALVQ